MPDSECEPADGCATVDSASGDLRAIHVATLLHRRPAYNYVYQLRSEREVTGIFDPGGAAKWDGQSEYLIVSFDTLPPRLLDADPDGFVRRWRNRSADHELRDPGDGVNDDDDPGLAADARGSTGRELIRSPR